MDEKYRISIGDRLREERDRLALSQEEFAALGSASKRTQAAWEKGDQVPNAEFLALVAGHGVDVLYVVTGQRALPIESTLSTDERELLANYEAADEVGKAFIENTAALAAQSITKRSKKTDHR